MDKKVTFPAGELTLGGRVWLATESRDVGVVLCHPGGRSGGDLCHVLEADTAATLDETAVLLSPWELHGAYPFATIRQEH